MIMKPFSCGLPQISVIRLRDPQRLWKIPPRSLRVGIESGEEFGRCHFSRRPGFQRRRRTLLSSLLHRCCTGAGKKNLPKGNERLRFSLSLRIVTDFPFFTYYQYQLIRGILDHNLGEQFAPFATPDATYLVDPVKVVGPEDHVYKNISIAIDLTNVTGEWFIKILI